MIPFLCSETQHPQVRHLIKTFGLQLCSVKPAQDSHYLSWEQGALSLCQQKTRIMVDFTSGSMLHRRKYGGGVNQPLAKAVGIKKSYFPHVLDATAGLGRDAFILATLGCSVTLLERAPIAACLLADGLARACQHHTMQDIISRMTLIHISAQNYLFDATDQYDVIYLDPMFPEHAKSALPKKEMQAFQALIGTDEDSDTLLPLARQLICQRIVVKRAISSPWLNNEKPHYSLTGKTTRFDIYLPYS